MYIFLSSNGYLADQTIKELINKPANQIKIAWLTTAGNVVDDRQYLKDHANDMLELKYDFEELDVVGKTQFQLKQALKDKDVLFVDGGNTFYLLKMIKETGFDKIIKEFLNNGGLYVGASAGSYIMCPTIEMATWKKDRNYPKHGLKDFTGLACTDFLVFAHYKPEHKKILQEIIPKTKYPVRILKDGQGILIKGKKIEFIGEGKEIKI